MDKKQVLTSAEGSGLIVVVALLGSAFVYAAEGLAWGIIALAACTALGFLLYKIFTGRW